MTREEAIKNLLAFNPNRRYSGIGADTIEAARDVLTNTANTFRASRDYEYLRQVTVVWNQFALRHPSKFHTLNLLDK